MDVRIDMVCDVQLYLLQCSLTLSIIDDYVLLLNNFVNPIR